MKTEIISKLRDYKNKIELSDDGYYENDCEIIELDFNFTIVSVTISIECTGDNVDFIEFIECFDSNEIYYDFSNNQIEEIESIIKYNTETSGGESGTENEYDPRTKGETL